MARYSPDHKDATRRRMIETSGRRFKRDGFDGAGISTLVADAGLTNGAFYGHFPSKDALIATVVSEQLATQLAQIEALPLGLASVEAFVADYLSPEHRDDPDNGCPSAALLDEIARQGVVTRGAYTHGTKALIDQIARHLTHGQDHNDPDPDNSRDRAIGLFTLLVGSLQLARSMTDQKLSDQVLAAAYLNAMTIVHSHTQGTP